MDKKNYDCYQTIESRRKELLGQSSEIEVKDFGAGSAVIKSKKRKNSCYRSIFFKAGKICTAIIPDGKLL